MRKFLMAAALMSGMAVLAGGLSAQQPEPKKGGGGGFGDFAKMRPIFTALGSSPAGLLMNKGVQGELKLTEEQIKTLGEQAQERMGGDFKDRMAKMMEKGKALEGVAEDKMEEKVREVFKEEIEAPMKEAEKVLKPDQIKRLKQIHFSNRGLALFTDYEYSKALKITAEQKTKAKEIQDELNKDLQELGVGGFGGGRPGGGAPGGGRPGGNRTPPSKETLEKAENLRKEAKEKGMELLTAEQKSTYKEMAGAPYEVKMERGAFGGPGGGRPNNRPKKDD